MYSGVISRICTSLTTISVTSSSFKTERGAKSLESACLCEYKVDIEETQKEKGSCGIKLNY